MLACVAVLSNVVADGWVCAICVLGYCFWQDGYLVSDLVEDHCMVYGRGMLAVMFRASVVDNSDVSG